MQVQNTEFVSRCSFNKILAQPDRRKLDSVCSSVKSNTIIMVQHYVPVTFMPGGGGSKKGGSMSRGFS